MQTVFVVNSIKEDYFFLKPEELKVCFNNAKKGKYGTMYDRIDAAVIIGWIDTFCIERTQIAIDLNVEQSKAYKREPISPIIEQALKNVLKDKPIEKVSLDLIEPEKRPRTEQEIIIDDIYKEFDQLHRDKPYDPNETIRSIPYMGKNITQSEFLQIRLEELNNL